MIIIVSSSCWIVLLTEFTICAPFSSFDHFCLEVHFSKYEIATCFLWGPVAWNILFYPLIFDLWVCLCVLKVYHYNVVFCFLPILPTSIFCLEIWDHSYWELLWISIDLFQPSSFFPDAYSLSFPKLTSSTKPTEFIQVDLLPFLASFSLSRISSRIFIFQTCTNKE